MKLRLVPLLLVTLVFPVIAQDTTENTNKEDIKELIKLPAFTNSIGMVMVRLSPSLWAGKYPVTQKEYQAVVGSNPSQFKGDRNPVDSVSYNDTVSFCGQLTEKEKKGEMLPDGFVYTLPTQSEWEMLMDGASLADAATSQNGNRSGTAHVGSLGPNKLGLYDTRGNVWAFTLDPQDRAYRVLRGGAWNTSIEINLRPEFRWYSNGPDDRKNVYGFRVVMKRN